MEDNLTQEALHELNKTISDMGGMAAVKGLLTKATDNSKGFSTRQSLDSKVMDFTKRKTPLFDMLPRVPVINTIHQWDAITAAGTGIASYAGPIDSVGVDTDVEIERSSEQVRYYRTTTTVGQFTNALSRPELQAQPTTDSKAVDKIKEGIEADILNGTASGNNIYGIAQIIENKSPATNTYTLSTGLTATTAFDEMQSRLVQQGGQASHFLFNAQDRISFKNLFTNQVHYNDPQTTNVYGYALQKYLSAFGEVDTLWDQFQSAKSGAPAASEALVLDITSWALGEPIVNGASGIASQELAKVGPKNTKLINYYGLLQYSASPWNGKISDIR